MIPILIWLEDRGPIFYRHQRAGKDGQPFTLLKFRTIVPEADRHGPAWVSEGDPRLTKVGTLLRRTALDELPGILTIWKGDMSLVGPRALNVEEQRWLETQIPGFARRLEIKPGLTGLAQVYDRDDDANTKLKYDLEYIVSYGLWRDLNLLVRSVLNTVTLRWDRRGGKPPAEAMAEAPLHEESHHLGT